MVQIHPPGGFWRLCAATQRLRGPLMSRVCPWCGGKSVTTGNGGWACLKCGRVHRDFPANSYPER